MLNFRKLKQDFSSSVLKEGKTLFDKKKIVTAKILYLDADTVRFSGEILSNFETAFESEIEIDRFESEMIHSNCDCTYRFDCQHLAALIFYLEENIDAILVDYSKQNDINTDNNFDDDQKEQLLETIQQAESKEEAKKDANYQREVLQEYALASDVLSKSPFFMPEENNKITDAEIAVIFNPKSLEKRKKIEFQLALRIAQRSKPLLISNIKMFLTALRYEEQIYLGGKKYLFSIFSFNEKSKEIISYVLDHAQFVDNIKNEKAQKIATFSFEVFGSLLSKVYLLDKANFNFALSSRKSNVLQMSSIFSGNLENPLRFSLKNASINFEVEHIDIPTPKLFLIPQFVVDESFLNIDDTYVFECAFPGILHDEVYYPFSENIKRVHLKSLPSIRDMTIPQPLFGTFVENSLPELNRFAEITHKDRLQEFVTLPFAGELKSKCEISYLDGELEASFSFFYDGNEIPSHMNKISFDNIESFVKEDGIIARNLVEEKKIIDELFQEFIFNTDTGTYFAKTDKKIIEFMTEVVPANKHRVDFDCPQNLLDQFIYDKSEFTLELDYEGHVGYYGLNLKVDGHLQGVSLDLLWECIASRRAFIEMKKTKTSSLNKEQTARFAKILVLELDKVTKIVQIFDEMGIKKLDNHKEEKPLWSIVNIDESLFKDLPVKFTMSNGLKDLKKQMLGEKEFSPSPIPKEIVANLRPYQTEGIHWLERLREMYLNGILADDMGLGKTLQAIVAITQTHNKDKSATSLVVCPTSLLYNWQEEILKFNKRLKVLIVDGIPNQRKKVISKVTDYDVIITSYTLMQKDVDQYKKVNFSYLILDEAQHIKNRGTRNAKSVKILNASHRLILTGTPIENSLDELWSLFDFLMPGLLSSFERFSEKYVRSVKEEHQTNIEYLKRKVSPFILRRMKVDVLSDLPPVSEVLYHCQLANTQKQLYHSYAESAKDELVKLVERDGFDKVQIHVLATLTRLKQICCHPAIFAKERPEEGDSAKYEMLLELLEGLIEGNHKTVIFSQYTRMLNIMREDFIQKGIKFASLDGTTKNRLQIVKDFNQNKDIVVFLVSLKAGGTGLNITGADTVIHYDMWWNPAVENQATDRVHRIGQTKNVTTYKLVTKNSIEEKIIDMQQRKRGLVKKVVSCDDEALAKLTWEDVLELLQT
jgi:SNF2 family DNA or RNA helicase